MPEKSDGDIDMDYLILAAAFAAGMTAITTVVSLVARPYLMELGRQLPLPDVNELIFGHPDGGE